MAVPTTNLALAKPVPGVETNWGPEINGNWDIIDTKLSQVLTYPLGQAVEVTYSPNPTFNLSTGSVQHIVLTGGVNGFSVSGPRDGQIYMFVIEQDSVGGHPFVFPASFKNAGKIDALDQDIYPNTVAIQSFIYLASRSAFFATTPLFYG